MIANLRIVTCVGVAVQAIGLCLVCRADTGLAKRAFEGRRDPGSHLRLAKEHAAEGRCGQALFHWSWYLRLQDKGGKPADPPAEVGRCSRKLKRPRLAKRKGLRKHHDRRVLTYGPPVSKDQILIPAGRFLSGSNDAEKRWARKLCLNRADTSTECQAVGKELHLRPVFLPSFHMDRVEVTGKRWLRCVAAGKCASIASASRHPALPVTGVSFVQARAYCRFAGGDLPTEEQWEKAARGMAVPVWIWPWGTTGSARCSCLASTKRPDGGKAQPAEPGCFLCDMSPYGVLDMGGNVAEWVVGARVGSGDRKAGSSIQPVVKGGSFKTGLGRARVAARRVASSGRARADIGFRCVFSVRGKVLRPPPGK